MVGVIKEIKGRDLRPGMVLAQPMNRNVTIEEVTFGRRYVRFWWKDDDHKYHNRVELNYPMLIEVPDPDDAV